MRYIQGIDYWVRYVQFPNKASESVAVSHGDGTFTIYINTLFPPARQAERLAHELRHLAEEHFYRDELTIRQIERSADGLADTPPAASSAAAIPGLSLLPAGGRASACHPPSTRRHAPAPEAVPRRQDRTPAYAAIRSAAMPEGASFGFRVPDDSLLPHFTPGQLLYCDLRPLAPGDVGLFRYRGVTLCRQYHRDAFGITYLFSLNRARSWEDIPVPSCDADALLCLGRVQTAVPIPLPGKPAPHAVRQP